MSFFDRSSKQPSSLPGRAETMTVPEAHFVNGNRLTPPFPDRFERAIFGMGCFWGAERKFWEAPGVYSTAVGYAGGATPNPTYKEVCSGMTGHTEVVLVVFDPDVTSYDALLRLFWENHDPTQGMRQGNDIGTQYRSAIYATTPEQVRAAEASRVAYQAAADRRRLRRASPPRSSTRRSSSMPRTITSSTWRRIRTAIAASAVPASPARWARVSSATVTPGTV